MSRYRNLDAQLRDEMRAEIKRLHQELKRTMIYVTHDQIEAMTLADRIVLLRDGTVEQQGMPLDLFECPASRFVAAFLGSPKMNFIPVEIAGSAAVLSGGTRLALPSARPLATGPAVFGIRPQHIYRASGTTAAARSKAQATVELVQITGTRVIATLAVGKEIVIADFEVGAPLSPGQKILVEFDVARASFFEFSNRACIEEHARVRTAEILIGALHRCACAALGLWMGVFVVIGLPRAQDRHASPELEALLPSTLGGVALTIESQAGGDLLTNSAAFDAFLSTLGKSRADFTVASAYAHGNLKAAAGIWRVKGADPALLLPGFKTAIQASSAASLESAHIVVAGRGVTRIGGPGQLAQGPLYVVVSGDKLVFVQTPEPGLAEEAMGKMLKQDRSLTVRR